MPAAANKAKTRRRVRRSPEEAKSEILDACERILRKQGSDALKLDLIAKESGYTSPVAVHHFGSIANVKKALILRMMENMLNEFNIMINESKQKKTPMETGIRRLFEIYRDPVYAKLIAWLVASNQTIALAPLIEPFLSHVNDTKHLLETTGREEAASPEKLASIFCFMTISAIGMGIGQYMLPKPMLDLIPPGEIERWVSELLVEKSGVPTE